MIEYDEFAYFGDNAEEWGLAYDGPPVVSRESVALADGRRLSALVWGAAAAEFFFLHGGAQNAHTYDTVALALARPLVAVDLPGHGHSDGVADLPDAMLPVGHARDVATALETLAPHARCVVGMSLGGLTAIELAAARPELVARLVLIDITPGVTGEKGQAIIDFVNGPPSFADFDELLQRTIEFNPTRSVSSLRRGILHNALQRPDGSWVWRHRRDDGGEAARAELRRAVDHGEMWETLGSLTMPVILVRGMREQSVVDDADVAEFRRRLPTATVVEVDAGHSVQGDQPIELAHIIADFVT